MMFAQYSSGGLPTKLSAVHVFISAALGLALVTAHALTHADESVPRRGDNIKASIELNDPNYLPNVVARSSFRDRRSVSTQGAPIESDIERFGFRQPISTDAVTQYKRVFPADVNADGDIDVVSVSFLELVWHENDGASPPNFTGRTVSVLSLPSSFRNAAAADLDGDGDLDLIAAESTGGPLNWYENDGENPPGFTVQEIDDAPVSNIGHLSATDLDGDGDVDVIAGGRGSDSNGILVWYENDGAGDPGFIRRSIPRAMGSMRSLIATDFDGDGDTDIIISDTLRTYWYNNDGQRPPCFTESIIPALTSNSLGGAMAAADLDMDGDLHLLVAGSFTSQELWWYENNTLNPPNFTPHLLSDLISAATLGMGAVDLDGDGDLDIISASNLDSRLAWYRNDGALDPSFTEFRIGTILGAQWIMAADLDNDGDPDIVGGGSAGGLDPDFKDDLIAWFENSPDESRGFTTHVISQNNQYDNGVDQNAGVRSVSLTDMDGDGDLDVLSMAASRGETAPVRAIWYENDGSAPPRFNARELTGGLRNSGQNIFGLDFDNDGDMDALSAGNTTWYENDGGQPPSFVARKVFGDDDSRRIWPADLDGDGDVDVVAGVNLPGSADRIVWYENDGVLNFTENVIDDVSVFEALYAADVDSDGDVDVLASWGSGFLETFVLFRNDGSPSPAFNRRTLSNDLVHSIYVEDMNDDGDPDIIAAGSTFALGGRTSHIKLYLNNGSIPPSFTTVFIYADDAFQSFGGYNANPFAVFAADINEDGYMDVVAGFLSDDKVSWFESDGQSPPAFTEHIISAVADLVRSVFVGDIDGDGDLDVISGSVLDSKVAWYKNLSPIESVIRNQYWKLYI